MIKKFLFILFLIFFCVVFSSSAETDTFFSAFDDAIKAIKDPIDETWEQSYDEVMETAGTLEEYTCESADNKISCEKTDSTGSCRIEFDFIDGSLAAIDAYLSNDKLSNYDISSNTEKITYPGYYSENDRVFFADFRVDDSIIEKLTGKTLEDAAKENIVDVSLGERILPGEDTAWSEYFFEFPENTFAQAGYRNVSEIIPEFQLRILAASWKYLVQNRTRYGRRDYYATGIIYEKVTENTNGSYTVTGYYDSKGEPAIHPEYGYVKSINYYGEDIAAAAGLPVSHPDKLTVYYDLNDHAVNNSSGYAYRTEEISEDGNTGTFRFFDTEMKPVPGPQGYAAYTLETIKKDELSNEKTIIYKYYDADMDPFTMEEGYAGKSVTSAPPLSHTVTTRYFDAEGKPVMISGGYASEVHYSDKLSATESYSYYGIDGEPVLTDNGYASYGHEPDTKRQVMIYYYRGVNGEPVIGPEGYAVREENRFGKGDPVTEVRFLDTDGNLVPGKDGYAYADRTKSEGESVLCFYDAEGNRTIGLDINASKIHTVYDPSGKAEREEYFGVNDEPVLNKLGYFAIEFFKEEDGKSEVVRYLDTENNPVLNEYGYAYSVKTFADNESMLCYYDPEGHRVVNRETNVSAVHFFYSPSGKQERIEYLNVNDELIPPDKLDFWLLYREYVLNNGVIYSNWD